MTFSHTVHVPTPECVRMVKEINTLHRKNSVFLEISSTIKSVRYICKCNLTEAKNLVDYAILDKSPVGLRFPE